HGRVVRDHHALDALHDADPGHDARADGVLGPDGSERRQLEEGRVAVEQVLDALARTQLAARAVARDVPLAAAGARRRHVPVELRQLREHAFAVLAELRGRAIDARAEDGHARRRGWGPGCMAPLY